MKKLLAVALFIMFLMPLAASQVLAADAGNKFCPISGDPVSPSVTTVYQGKTYYFCCSGCIAKFEAEPEKYIAKMKEQEQSAASKEGHEHRHNMGM